MAEVVRAFAVESIVTAAHDFDEMVDLLALSRPFERSAGMTMAC
jgi:hypothetical protein